MIRHIDTRIPLRPRSTPGKFCPVLPRSASWTGTASARYLGKSIQLRLPWGSHEVLLPINWHRKPRSTHEQSIQARLHYMDYLSDLSDDLFIQLVRDWIINNPQPDWAVSWRPYNLSIRVAAWLTEISRRHRRLPSDFLEETASSIALQITFLRHRLETDIRGNHLIKNLKAILWASVCIEHGDAKKWLAQASRGLVEEMKEQVLSDGCHYERSPTYHCQVLADLIDCWIAVHDKSTELGAVLVQTIEKMISVAHFFSHPDGFPSLFNDGGLAMAPTARECAEVWTDVSGMSTMTFFNGSFAMSAAGYWGTRQEDVYLIIDCGPLGANYLVGHGHGDLLSFEWSVMGRRVVVDQGTYQYRRGMDRDITRQSRSHNAVTIDDMDPFDFFGAHRCGRRATPAPLLSDTICGKFCFRGTHNGFSSLPGSPQHVRDVEMTGKSLTVIDRIYGGKSPIARARFLLHPDWSVGVEGNVGIMRSGDAEVRITSNVSLGLEEAEWFPNMYVRIRTSRLTMDVPLGEEGLIIRFEGRSRDRAIGAARAEWK